jgi:rare lipoprotein A
LIHRALPAVLAAALAGCTLFVHKHAPTVAIPHYVVGQPYQAAGLWRYPRQSFDGDETGLASVTARTTGFTADGEVADPTALAAAHPTLQLPAIARVTNLDTGLQVLVRVNDRGPEQRGRAIALTPRAVHLLGGDGQPALRVRVQVMEAESRRLAAELNGDDAPQLRVATAAPGAVATETLAPPPGAQQAPQAQAAPSAPAPAEKSAPETLIPLRLPEQVFQIPPRPGGLYVEAGTFGQLKYAEMLRRRLAQLGAQTSTSYDAPRDRAYRVRIGPLPSVAAADAMLDRTIRAGIPDARIVAE